MNKIKDAIIDTLILWFAVIVVFCGLGFWYSVAFIVFVTTCWAIAVCYGLNSSDHRL